MKWAKARRHRTDYYAWQDLLHVMLVTLVLAIVAAIVIFLLLVIMNPRVATAGDIVNFRRERRLAAAVAKPQAKVTARALVPLKVIYCEISAYSPTVAETDGNPLRTASGKRVYVGGIAADLRVLPFGSQVIIPGYNGGNPCEVIDTGSMIRGNTLDVFFWKAQDSVNWGRRRNVRVEVLYIPKVTP